MRAEMKDPKTSEVLGVLEIPIEPLIESSKKVPLNDSEEVAKLKEQVVELSTLRDKVAHFEDPDYLKGKLMALAETWTEDEYRLFGEARGFTVARPLTPDEEAALADDDLAEKGKVPMSDVAAPGSAPRKTIFVFNERGYEDVE